MSSQPMSDSNDNNAADIHSQPITARQRSDAHWLTRTQPKKRSDGGRTHGGGVGDSPEWSEGAGERIGRRLGENVRDTCVGRVDVICGQSGK